MIMWNPWHGCHKISPGCQNCYVYLRDALYDKDSSIVNKTANFDLPIKKNRNKEYKLKPGQEIFTCGTSDFFLPEADTWRPQAWSFIKARPDLRFLIITKRIHRFAVSLPDDWNDGYENVTIGCTAENQEMADYRLPLFIRTKIKKRIIICEPLLESVDLSPYLATGLIENVTAGGESGEHGRVCDYDWILSLRQQCVTHHVAFHFKQTGTHFQRNGKIYTIERKKQHSQAKKAEINYHA